MKLLENRSNRKSDPTENTVCHCCGCIFAAAFPGNRLPVSPCFFSARTSLSILMVYLPSRCLAKNPGHPHYSIFHGRFIGINYFLKNALINLYAVRELIATQKQNSRLNVSVGFQFHEDVSLLCLHKLCLMYVYRYRVSIWPISLN
jgi:hypothetical protein